LNGSVNIGHLLQKNLADASNNSPGIVSLREYGSKTSAYSEFSKNKKPKNALVSLEYMEDYCKNENIFFTDK